MKVLFVCRGNVGRSQMAQALFEKLSGLKSFSAGTKVNFEGRKIGEIELAKSVVDSMKKHGCDVSENVVRQLTPKMVLEFDKVIVMAEPETIPDYLKGNKKEEFWDIEDPKGKDETFHKNIILQIKRKILELIKNNKIT